MSSKVLRNCNYHQLFFCFWLLLTPSTTILGFQIDHKAQIPVIKVETDLVEVPVTVTDRKGNPIDGLTIEDFKIYEDGIEQTLSLFASNPGPVSWGLILDVSGSMRMMIDEVSESAIHMVEAATPGSEVFIITFNNHPDLILGFTDNRKLMRSSVSSLLPGGGTALWDAVAAGLNEMKKSKYEHKAIMIVTDGEDNMSVTDTENLLEKARESDVLIYSTSMIKYEGFLSGPDSKSHTSRVLETLAEVSGAYAHNPQNMRECRRVMEHIADEVSHQYILGYYPRYEGELPRFRKLNVMVHSADRSPLPVVRARKGYWGPRAPED